MFFLRPVRNYDRSAEKHGVGVRPFVTFVGSIFLLLGVGARAAEPCLEAVLAALADQRNQRSADQKAVANYDFSQGGATQKDLEAPTVFYAQGDPTIAGPHGPSFKFERLGPRWRSNDGYKDRNPSGDPTALKVVFGTAVSRYLGIEFPSDQAAILPSADRINWAIDQINARREGAASHRIGIRFYETSGKQPAISYLSRFADEGALPIAHELRLHDTDLHVPAILIPEAEIDLARRQIRCFLEFRDYVLNHLDGMAEWRRTKTLELLAKLADIYVLKIDTGTGNFGTAYIAARKGGPWARTEVHDIVVNDFAQGGTDPLTALRRAIRQVDRNSDAGFVDFSRLNSDMKSFLEESSTRWADQKGLERTPTQLFNEIKARRTALEATVLFLPEP